MNLNQKDFARAFGVSQVSISRWESGEREIPVGLLELLGESLNINLNWLCNGKGEMFNNGVSEENFCQFLTNKDIIDTLGKDEHTRYLFDYLKDKSLIKDLFYLIVKESIEKPENIDEYLKVLSQHLKDTNQGVPKIKSQK